MQAAINFDSEPMTSVASKSSAVWTGYATALWRDDAVRSWNHYFAREENMFNFKKYYAFLCCLGLLLSLPLALPRSSEARFSITIYFGQRPSCEGFGLCRIVIDTSREADAPKGGETARAARRGEASATIEQDKTARTASHRLLKIEMRTAVPDKASVIPVSENIALDAATSKALGFKSVTVLRGEYKIDYSKNKLGSIALSVDARN